MNRIQPELLESFCDEARTYLDRIRLFVADPMGERLGPDAVRSDLENLKGVSALVGLTPPRRIAERLLELLNDPSVYFGKPFSIAAQPFVDALGEMLDAVQAGKLETLDDSLAKAESYALSPSFPSVMPVDLSEELMGLFLAEGAESSRGMEQALSVLRREPKSVVERTNFFRHLINLKGAAGMVNQHGLIRALDMMRDVFEAAEAGRLDVDATVTRFFVVGIRTVTRMLTDLRAGEVTPPKILDDFSKLAKEHFPAFISVPPPTPEMLQPSDEQDQEDMAEAELLRELRQIFLAEAQEHVAEMRHLILEAQAGTPADDLAQRFFRVVHTLKGASATAGMRVISEAAHELENVIDAWRQKAVSPDEALLDLLYECEGVFHRMLEEAAEGADPDAAHGLQVKQRVARFLAGYGADLSSASLDANGVFPDLPDADERGPDLHPRTVRVPIDRLDSLINLASELSAHRTRLDDTASEFAIVSKRLKWERRNLTRLMGEFHRKHQWETHIPGLSIPEGGEFSELEFDRYSDINVFTRNIEDLSFKIGAALELVEQHMGRFREDSQVMGGLVAGVKDELIQARMVSLESLFMRIDFQTQHLARSLGKKVRVITRGGRTEVDKSLSEALVDPLLHLIRNSLDHGFEPPAERRKMKKPDEGTLTLTATQNARSVVLQVRDDGRGINTEKLASVAVRKSLFTAEELASRSPDDLLSLIYHPRVSTSESAGEVSGRGVGMDVVRHAISEMYGSIVVESEAGRGTCFTITLPLTLAVQPILSASADPHIFNLPMHYVTRLLEADELELLLDKNQRVVHLEREKVPVRWLAAFVGLDHDPEVSSHPGIVLKAGDRRMVLVVDAVSGREEAIVRPLPPLLDACTHVLGTTITPKGEVRLVLNVPFLFEMDTEPGALSVSRFPPRERVKVLIADDSLSVRQTIKYQLTRRGIKANTAKDGLAAWQKLHGIRPDLLIVDLEMPGLNGYELMEHVRQSPDFANLPMLVLTSRGGAKHHQKAMTCGADGFLTKPALERELISRIRAVLPSHLRDLLDARDPLLKV